MRVISLVPSWTETLIECDIEVVGRTRFCIHPQATISGIPAVGGTKDVDWQKVKPLNPDIILFDEEENLKAMAEGCPYPWISTHVSSLASLPGELEKLAHKFKNPKLTSLATRWEQVQKPFNLKSLQNTPGVMKWIRKPEGAPKQFAYIIWKNPWMAVGDDTFIGSIFQSFGFENYFKNQKYPKFEIEEIPQDVVLLFSSEPYPFEKKLPNEKEIPNPMAIVDGEKYGWFGVRSLLFLESLKKTSDISH